MAASADRGLHADTRAVLRRRLGDEPALLAFAEAVVRQCAHPPGRRGTRLDERRAAERTVRALDHVPAEAASRTLAEDEHLLAAFFQNIDLLYPDAAEIGDAVGPAVLRAVALAGGET